TSGASVPEDLVDGMLARLAESGFDQVEEVEAVPERMQFALPHELRRGKAGPPQKRAPRAPPGAARLPRAARAAQGPRGARGGAGQRRGSRGGASPRLATARRPPA